MMLARQGVKLAKGWDAEEVAETVQLGDHGTTYGGNPLACAAANAVIRTIEEEGSRVGFP